MYSTPLTQAPSELASLGRYKTQKDAEKEIARIKGELKKIQKKADFPVDFLPIARVQGA